MRTRAAVAALILALALPAAAQQLAGEVVGVTDGDTLKVLTAGNVEVTVRIWGIDAPESGDAYSNVAKQRLSVLVFGQRVELEGKGPDRYGRTVARVTVGDIDVGQTLVREGLAWHYVEYAPNDVELRDAQAAARSDRRNIWTLPNPLPPWERRAVERTVRSAAAGILYHGNTSSKIYHSPSCRYYSCKNCTRTFQSTDAAKAAGYRACKVCRPG